MSSEKTVEDRIGEDALEHVARTEGEAGPPGRAAEAGRPPGDRTGLHPDAAQACEGPARLAPGAAARVRRLGPGRRGRLVNAALGAGIFASMGAAAVAILGGPHGYIFAAGFAALAAIMLAREARGDACRKGCRA